jgi:transposase
VINALRAHLAELGITAAQGTAGVKELLKIIANDEDERLPVDARASLVVLAAELQAMQTLIGSLEKRIMAQHRKSEASRRLQTIPGIGFIGRPRSPPRLRTRRASGPDAILRPGLDLCRGKIRPGASRSSVRSRNRGIVICDAF